MVLIRVNFAIQALWALVTVFLLGASLIERDYIGVFIYLLIPLGATQVIFAILLRLTSAPLKTWLNGYLLAVVLYFAGMALITALERMDIFPGDWMQYYVWPFSFLYTFFFWYYSFRTLKVKA